MRSLLFLISGVAAWPWSKGSSKLNIQIDDCTTSSDKGKVAHVSYSPKEPKEGDTLTITGNGQLLEDLDGGSYDIAFKLGGLASFAPPIHRGGNICGDTSFSLPLHMGTAHVHGISCPHKEGNVTLSQVLPIPEHLPASVHATLRAKDKAGNELLCLKANISTASTEAMEAELMNEFNAVEAIQAPAAQAADLIV